MRTLLAAALLLVCGCGPKSQGTIPGPAPGPGGPLTYLPAKTEIVVGFNRLGTEDQARAAVKGLLAVAEEEDLEMPDCLIDVVARVEWGMAGLSPNMTEIGLLVHGDGLHVLVDACAKTHGVTSTVAGDTTTYRYEDNQLPVRWLGPDEAVVRTAGDATLPKGHPLAQAMARTDTKSSLWGVAHGASVGMLGREFGLELRGIRGSGQVGNDDVIAQLVFSFEGDDGVRAARKTLDQYLRELGKMGGDSLQPLIKALQVSRDGNDLHLSIAVTTDAIEKAIPDHKMLLPFLEAFRASGGVALAVVALPSFMKYGRKSKSSEAVVHLKQMYDGARSFYEGGSGTPPRFPKSAPAIAPPLGSCCRQGGKCQPDPTLWTDATWQELKFSVDDPSYYSYGYASDSKTFTATAFGDLDCDGVYSTFEMVGSIAADGTVTGQGGMFRDKELE
jgi:hypothetical protein